MDYVLEGKKLHIYHFHNGKSLKLLRPRNDKEKKDLILVISTIKTIFNKKNVLGTPQKPTLEELVAIKAALMAYEADKKRNFIVKPPVMTAWKLAFRLRM